MKRNYISLLSTRTSLGIGVTLFFLISFGLLYLFFNSNPNVAIALQIEKADPLFDFPGATPAELEEVSKIIAEANRTIWSVHPETRGYSFYPYRFWGAVAAVAESREAFYREPTRLRGVLLYSAEYRALGAYKKDLASLSRLWRRSIGVADDLASRRATFPFLPGVTTDIPTADAALALFQKNAEALGQDLKLRRNCLFVGSCAFEKQAYVLASIEPASKRAYPPNPKLLPPSIIAKTLAVLNAEPTDGRLYSADTACFGKDAALFFLWARNISGQNVFLPKLATDSFFRLVEEKGNLPQDYFVRQEKLPYSWQPETNWYMCPDLTYYPQLAAMRALVRMNADMPLADKAAEAAGGKVNEELQESEKDLKHAAPITPELISNYIRNLSAAGNDLPEESPLKSEIKRRLGLWKTKSGDLPEIMQKLESEMSSYRDIIRMSKKPTRIIFPLISRSHVSLLYAPWNPTVWRIEEKPQFFYADRGANLFTKNYWEVAGELDGAVIGRIQELSLQKLVEKAPQP